MALGTKFLDVNLIRVCIHPLSSVLDDLDFCMLRMTCKGLKDFKKQNTKGKVMTCVLAVQRCYVNLSCWMFEKNFPFSDYKICQTKNPKWKIDRFIGNDSLQGVHSDYLDTSLAMCLGAYGTLDFIDECRKTGLNRLYYSLVLEGAAEAGREDIINYYMRNLFIRIDMIHLLYKIASGGNFQLFQTIAKKTSSFKYEHYSTCILKALQNEQFEFLEEFKTFFSLSYLSWEIVELKTTKSLDWIKANYPNFVISVSIHRACEIGNIVFLDWALENYKHYEYNEYYLQVLATKHRHVDILKWFISKGFKLDPYIYQIAIEHSSFEILDYLYTTDLAFTDNLCTFACKQNNLAAVKWLIERNYPCDIKECLKATKDQQIIGFINSIHFSKKLKT